MSPLNSDSFISLPVFKSLNFEIYKIIILSVVLYDHATWSLILRDECRLRVF